LEEGKGKIPLMFNLYLSNSGIIEVRKTVFYWIIDVILYIFV